MQYQTRKLLYKRTLHHLNIAANVGNKVITASILRYHFGLLVHSQCNARMCDKFNFLY